MRKNMKIPREKEKPEQPVIISRITRLPAWSEPTRSNQAKEMEVVMKNNVWKTYEWKHCEIQNLRFSHMVGEDYDDSLFQ
jgi:hypothetical protein